MTTQYKVTVNLQEKEKVYTTFKEAFVEFYNAINATASMSLMCLEQACWIEEERLGLRRPIMFYGACDQAVREGILSNEGNLI